MTFREFCKSNLGFTDLDDYYGAYNAMVNAIGYDKLRACIPVDDETLVKAYKADKHFNSIPIKKWDAWTGNYAYITKYGVEDYRREDSTVKRLLRGIGIDCFSVSECVSLLKNTARMCVVATGKE